MIISSEQAQQLLESNKKGLKEIDISLDLNQTKTNVKIENGFFIFPNNQKLDESQLKKPMKEKDSCFLIRDNSAVKIQMFSEGTNKFYKLVPTKDAPTIEISGIRMHVTKEMTPMEDTKKKIESIMPIKGIVLDTCMGLGYTAISASKHAEFVFTCERDENVIEIAKFNPWSKELFHNTLKNSKGIFGAPKIAKQFFREKINILNTSILNQIEIFKNSMFDAVIHDPPRLNLASELYSLNFYKQLFRVLKKDGKLYHYIGSPGSKNRKINLAGNVANRLRHAGFKDVEKAHYGLTAIK